MGTECGQVIAGLGNPGLRYCRNRHNVGFMVLDALAGRLGCYFEDSTDQWQAATSRGVCLVKPLTYMNCSGEALMAWSRATGVDLTGRVAQKPSLPADGLADAELPVPELPTGIRPLIICDDLALPLGSVRLRGRGSSGGQNGLASVIENLGGVEFSRLRLGIAPLTGTLSPAEWADYVLADFAEEETPVVTEMIEHAVAAVECWLAEGLEVAVSRFNRRVRPAE